MMVARIMLIRSPQTLDGIVIVERGYSIVPAAGAVKPRPQILRGTGNFRTGLHAYAAGEAGGDHHGLTTTRHRLKFDHAFIYIYLSEATTIDLNVKLGATDRNDRAGSADLECRRSTYTLLNLRADAADQQLKIFPATGFRLLQQQLRMSTHQHIAAIREFQQQTSFVRAHCCIGWQDLTSDRSSKGLCRKLNADFPLEVGDCRSGVRRAGGRRLRSFLGCGEDAIKHEAD